MPHLRLFGSKRRSRISIPITPTRPLILRWATSVLPLIWGGLLGPGAYRAGRRSERRCRGLYGARAGQGHDIGADRRLSFRAAEGRIPGLSHAAAEEKGGNRLARMRGSRGRSGEAVRPA